MLRNYETICPLREAMLSPWFVARIDFSSHSEYVLCGYVYGHPRLRSANQATTSPILEFSADDSWARTQNTLYWLHEPAVPGKDNRAFGMRLSIAAKSYHKPPVSLLGICMHVTWPNKRSPGAKFRKPAIN
jgi:hypothetical protein